MNFQRRVVLLSIAIIVVVITQLACGLAGAAPTQSAVQPTQSIFVTQVPIVQAPPAVPESRLLTLDYPSFIRAGDSDIVRLTLEVDANGNITPTVSQSGNQSQSTVVTIPNVYDTYNVMAEARLDMAGVAVKPNELVSETLLPRTKVTFFWSVMLADVGVYKGTVWFYLHFLPKKSGTESQEAISAQVISIEGTSFFGIRANIARWLGLGGGILSTLLGIPFLESIIRWIWKRLRGGE